MSDPTRPLLMGRIHGAFGLRGELKVESFTAPETALLGYQPWNLRDTRGRWRELSGARGRAANKGLIVTLPGIHDRNAADTLRGVEIFIPRSTLPPPRPGEFYQADLEGLRVRTIAGVMLGTVTQVLPTGANDVLVVHGERERMIPFIRPQTVQSVDLAAGEMVVDWDPDF